MARAVDRLRSLVEGLYSSTESGLIRWKERSSGGYSVSIAGTTVTIESEGVDVRVSVFNELGEVADSFTDRTLQDYTPQSINFSQYFPLMTNLLEYARRSATGADELIDHIIKEIGAPKIDSDEDDIPF